MKTEDAAKLNLVEISKICANEDAARDLMESILWPTGPVCPHCKGTKAYKLVPKPGSKTRKGLYKCADCRKQFTVTVGTIFADSHIPISKWLMAIFILCSAKKAISAHQLHRSLGIAYKSAWFMAHRLRYAMEHADFTKKLSGVVEVDECYFGPKPPRDGGPKTEKIAVVGMVERKTGERRSTLHKHVVADSMATLINEHVEDGATINTDSSGLYDHTPLWFNHKSVNHERRGKDGQREYYRIDKTGDVVTTNFVESSFSLLRRGVIGAFHHISQKHLHRYVSEFDFRWNHRKTTCGERTIAMLAKTPGKRLKYANLTA